MNAERPTSNEQPRKYDLEDRLLEYAAEMIRITDRLPRTPAGSHVAWQLLRSGTSPLPNHGEAQDAESVDDFIRKFKVCLKEFRESHRWLRLINRVPLLEPASQVDPMLQETDELIRIFKASVKTAEQRRATRGRPVRRSKFIVQCSSFRS